MKFKIELDLIGNVIKGNGETMLEAMQALPKPVKITTKGVLTATYGKKSAKQDLTVMRVKRLFFPISQALLSRYLMQLLK